MAEDTTELSRQAREAAGDLLQGAYDRNKPVTGYTRSKGLSLFAPVRFIWNATRGHRLAPWRSDYLRWRIETYSGQKAESLTTRKILAFLWSQRWELLSFLAWTGQLDIEVRKRV